MLWALVLLALIVAELGTNGRMEAKIARNLMANAEAEAAADGAVNEAIFHLSDTSDQGWQPDATLHRMQVGPVPVELRIEDESGKINPNTAAGDLLESLLVVLGVERGQALALTQGILDWRGGEPAVQQAAIAQRYQAAGLKYQPTFAPFETVDDVALVIGMPPGLADRLLPHLSVHQIGIADPSRADPIVARALAQLSGSTSAAQPPVPVAYHSVTINAVARTREGAQFTRRAIVRLGPGLPHGFAILVWDAPGTG